MTSSTKLRPVPQANNLATLTSVVDAIANGCLSDSDVAEAIGVTARQGSYYTNAAADLGLIVETKWVSPREWELTEEGNKFANLDATLRSKWLVEALCENEWVVGFINEPDTILTRLEQEDLGEITVARRADCIRSWADFVFNNTEKEQTKAILGAVAEAKTRIPTIAARAAQSRKAVQVVTKVTYCNQCGTSIPRALDACEMCN